MINCPNKSLKSWKDLVSNVGENKAYVLWTEYDGNVPDQYYNSNLVGYDLKAVDILSSDKAKQVFEKGKKNNWDLNKILIELQVPKEQKQIILDKNISNREEIITSLLADNSFVVEINTAKGGSKLLDTEFNAAAPEWMNEDFLDRERTEGDNNTSFYSNLTVPGGTNYTENEIATPDIVPNIKGHAQFSTDKGIGWFRSDNQEINLSLLEQQGIIKKVPC